MQKIKEEIEVSELEYNLICDFIKLRNELGLTQKQMAEEAKVALRNVRQDENNKIKKDADLTEDEKDMCLEIVQELIDKYNKIVDEKFKEKETELTSI